MRAVRGTERIVDVDFAERRQRACEIGIVRFLLGMEANVLEQQDVAVLQFGDRVGGDVADAVAGERDRRAEPLVQFGRHRTQRHGRHGFPVRAAEVREDDRLRAVLLQVAQRAECRFDAGRIADRTVLHRDVEIFTHDDAFAAHVERIESLEFHAATDF